MRPLHGGAVKIDSIRPSGGPSWLLIGHKLGPGRQAIVHKICFWLDQIRVVSDRIREYA